MNSWHKKIRLVMMQKSNHVMLDNKSQYFSKAIKKEI